MSSHECRQGCQCKKQVIPVIFVPDLLGTRLYNTSEKAVVWDPLAGMGSYHTPLGTAIEDLSGKVSKTTAAITSSPMVKKLIELQTVLKGLQGALNDLYKLSSRVLKSVGLDDVAKRIDAASQDANADSKSAVAKVKAQLADIKKKIAHIEKEINNAFEKMGQVEEVLRIARNVWGMISVLEWMFRDASERRKLLVGKKIGRDDTILTIPQDAEKGSKTYDKTYYLGQTAIRPSDSADRHLRGWGEVCWAQYGEFLMTLQRHLDAHFNLREVAQAGATTEMGSIPKPSLVTGKALKDLFAAIEKLFDFTPAAPAAAPATPAATPSAGTEANKAAEPAKKEDPLPWGANPNFAKQMARFAFPLHVVGYNWMQGSADGAQRLKRRIKQIAGSYQPGSSDETWMTKEPVKQVIVITHGMGGQVMRALLAEVGPETDGKGGDSGGENPEKQPSAKNNFKQPDPVKKSDAAQHAKDEQSPQFSIKPEPNPFGKDLELLKAIHVGVPQTGMPEIYAWFRAGMQTPVKSDSTSDMAVAYVTNQVLGANAAEITAVLSYSQCGLEALPNNDYPKGWLCWQPMPFNLVEGEKPPELNPITIDEDVYNFYGDDSFWYRLINRKLVNYKKNKIEDSFYFVKELIKKSNTFEKKLKLASTCNVFDKFIVGENSKATTRGKICWQSQSKNLPNNGDAQTWDFYWQNIPSDNLFVKGVNKIFNTDIFSQLVDSGEGTVYLSEKGICTIAPPVKFDLQKGASKGDGMVSSEPKLNVETIVCSEHHTDIYQDENIRKAVYKEIQQASWDFNEKSKKKGK
ncbi:hypothetical protein Entas_3843 [Enterobacter soli]|uniref:hypothetical protein n=1 Tax=Enterobacter soli TaxID=885040 RepID=UPI000223D5EA|nr:hypothetical protein [Enterobacter soli]AEN66553.1 hypothetical protein Entas_3843 [Enterobacter soli]OAT42477.1 hypothetical protein M987_00547 [Enterobacter soli ATCC BAA-2102]